MIRKLYSSSLLVLGLVSVVGFGSAQAQTPDQVAKFDAGGTPVDSAITEVSGAVGIGTYPTQSLDVNGNINYSGQLTKLDVGTAFASTVRAADFFLGHPSRRGAPGRALVDFSFGGPFPRSELVLNFADDFTYTTIGGASTMVTGTLGVGVLNPWASAFILRLQDSSTGRGLARGWDLYSSRRWKENITPIDNPLAKVERLQGVYFDWKKGKTHDMGFIAEEVGEVIPEVVTYEPNGKDALAVDYARLTALLVEAVKEQQGQIKQLKSEIEELRSTRD